MDTNAPAPECGPWNPGLESQLPRKYLHLSTMFRSANVSTTIAEADELSDFCGLPAHQLVAFRARHLCLQPLGIVGIEIEDVGLHVVRLPSRTLVDDTIDRTVQVYGAVPDSALPRPPRRLVGFARVALGAGASLDVEIPADLAALEVRRHGEWLREPPQGRDVRADRRC